MRVRTIPTEKEKAHWENLDGGYKCSDDWVKNGARLFPVMSSESTNKNTAEILFETKKKNSVRVQVEKITQDGCRIFICGDI